MPNGTRPPLESYYPIPFEPRIPGAAGPDIIFTEPEIAGAGRRGVPVVPPLRVPGSFEEFQKPLPPQIRWTIEKPTTYIEVTVADRVTRVLEPSDSGPLITMTERLREEWSDRRQEIADLENQFRREATPPIPPAPRPARIPRVTTFGVEEQLRIVLMLDKLGASVRIPKELADRWRSIVRDLNRIRFGIYPLYYNALEKALRDPGAPPGQVASILARICSTVGCPIHPLEPPVPRPEPSAPFIRRRPGGPALCLVPWYRDDPRLQPPPPQQED